MLKREGYKMFRGTMEITPINCESYKVVGVWLYKPEYECWYCNGTSYPVEVCNIISDLTV